MDIGGCGEFGFQSVMLDSIKLNLTVCTRNYFSKQVETTHGSIHYKMSESWKYVATLSGIYF